MNENLSNFQNSKCNKCKKNFDFNQKKKNAINSLTEVESFLRNVIKTRKTLKLYNILKKSR